MPVIGAYAHERDAWLVDSSETVWYSRDQGIHWSSIYIGGYPKFYTDGKVENRVFFADGRDGMWILSAGTQIILHKYR